MFTLPCIPALPAACLPMHSRMVNAVPDPLHRFSSVLPGLPRTPTDPTAHSPHCGPPPLALPSPHTGPALPYLLHPCLTGEERIASSPCHAPPTLQAPTHFSAPRSSHVGPQPRGEERVESSPSSAHPTHPTGPTLPALAAHMWARSPEKRVEVSPCPAHPTGSAPARPAAHM